MTLLADWPTYRAPKRRSSQDIIRIVDRGITVTHPAGEIYLREPLPGKDFGDVFPIYEKDTLTVDGKLDPATVRQQRLTNCPLPALLAAMANARPNMIKSMIKVVKHDEEKNIWFHNRYLPVSRLPLTCKETLKITFQRKTIEISPFVYSTNSNPDDPSPRFGKCKDGSGWMPYIEKAYVIYRCNSEYSGLDLFNTDRPLTVSRIVEDIAYDFDMIDLGARTLFNDLEPISIDPPSKGTEQGFTTTSFQDFTSQKSLEKAVKDRLALVRTRPTIVVNSNHTKAVFSYSNGTVEVFDAMKGAKRDYTFQDFMGEFEAIYQVR